MRKSQMSTCGFSSMVPWGGSKQSSFKVEKRRAIRIRKKDLFHFDNCWNFMTGVQRCVSHGCFGNSETANWMFALRFIPLSTLLEILLSVRAKYLCFVIQFYHFSILMFTLWVGCIDCNWTTIVPTREILTNWIPAGPDLYVSHVSSLYLWFSIILELGHNSQSLNALHRRTVNSSSIVLHLETNTDFLEGLVAIHGCVYSCLGKLVMDTFRCIFPTTAKKRLSSCAVTCAHLGVARSQALVVLLLLRIKPHHELKCFPLK